MIYDKYIILSLKDWDAFQLSLRYLSKNKENIIGY
jgi:hypothetical protein